MKICAFNTLPEEAAAFDEIAGKTGTEIICVPGSLEVGTAELAKGCDAVCILGWSIIDGPVIDKLLEIGVKAVGTRSRGFNQIDVDYARSHGFMVCNSTFPPDGVADFAVMLLLACIRKYKEIIVRQMAGDFTLDGVDGPLLSSLTVSILGAGGIGGRIAKDLSGFGCEELFYNRSKNPELEKIGRYASLDEIYEKSDAIVVALPLDDSTYHMLDANAFSRMKDGVTIVNIARGEIIDNHALMDALDSGKVGAAGLDVIEGENAAWKREGTHQTLRDRDIAYLRQLPNVVLTQHASFFTTGVRDVVSINCVKSLKALVETGTCPTVIVGKDDFKA